MRNGPARYRDTDTTVFDANYSKKMDTLFSYYARSYQPEYVNTVINEMIQKEKDKGEPAEKIKTIVRVAGKYG